MQKRHTHAGVPNSTCNLFYISVVFIVVVDIIVVTTSVVYNSVFYTIVVSAILLAVCTTIPSRKEVKTSPAVPPTTPSIPSVL